jgi:hypothetical protein
MQWMRRDRTQRHESNFLPCLTLALCAALFAWGVQAGLCRFAQQDPTHRRTSLRLINDDLVKKKACLLQPPERGSARQLAAFKADFGFRPRLPVRGDAQVRRLAPSFVPRLTAALYFRPPPVKT